MAIDKVVLQPMRFVDGPPMAGQSRINWIQDGERLYGAKSPYTNEGELNRASVQIQTNVADLFDNVALSTDIVNRVVDLVNIHETIINPTGDGSDLFQRMENVELDILGVNDSIEAIHQELLDTEGVIDEIRKDIGAFPVDQVYRTVRAELTYQKNMMGNYTGFDWDGNPSVDAIGRGMKGQIERNRSTISNHEVRLAGLEKWWDGATPDYLISETRSLRDEMGQKINAGSAPVYDRLNLVEYRLDSDESDVENLKTHTHYGHFPIDMLDSDGDKVVAHSIWEYAQQTYANVYRTTVKLGTTDIEVKRLVDFIGDPTDAAGADTIFGTTKDLKDRVVEVEGIVGLTETDGLRGDLKALDLREEGHYNRVDNIIQNLSDHLYNDTDPKVATIYADMVTRVDNIPKLMYGDADGLDPYTRDGMWSTGYEMYKNMYLDYIAGGGFILNPGTNNEGEFVRSYDTTQNTWVWKDVSKTDRYMEIGTGVVTQNDANVISVDWDVNLAPVVTVGDDSGFVQVDGTLIGDINFLDTATISLDGENIVSSVPFGDGYDIAIGNATYVEEIKFLTKTGNGMVIEDDQGESHTILTDGNGRELLDIVDAREGFKLVKGAILSGTDSNDLEHYLVRYDEVTDMIVMGDHDEIIKFDSNIADITLNAGAKITGERDTGIADLIKVDKVGAEELVIVGGTVPTAINLIGNDPKSAYVTDGANLLSIWHDGLDAPKDDAYYARFNGAWVGFNPTGGSGGGIGEEAPDNGKQYTRVSENGVGRWDLVGNKQITLQNQVGIDYLDIGGTKRNLFRASNDGQSIDLGDNDTTFNIPGKIGINIFDSTIYFANGTEPAAAGIQYFAGSSAFGVGIRGAATTLLGTSLRFNDGTANWNVWHDGYEAPRDGKYYGRKDGNWTQMFNGVNPAADVVINTGSRYMIDTVNVAGLSKVGQVNTLTVGQTGINLDIQGNVGGFSWKPNVITTYAGITGTTTTATGFNLIGTGHSYPAGDYIRVGDTSVSLNLQGSLITANGSRVLTLADDAPSDGTAYVRKGNGWAPAYYYGAFATDAPVNPKEGDVFFEFIN